MKFSEKWLREWVDPEVDAATLAEQLTTAGLEVDSVEPVCPEFDGVVVGEVLDVEPHPDAERLRVCRVEAGQGEPLTIVCGAPNVYTGMKAPTALVGALLPGGMKIKRAKLRGVASFGMLSSAKELGLAESSEGLMELPADAPVGQSIRAWLELEDNSIEVDLTPNRGDCLGVAGIAREAGLLNRCPVSPPQMEPVAAVISDEFPVTLDAPADCPRYLGRVIRNVDPKAPTPIWMQERLRRSGLRSISASVDVTNYVLLELGQPMHAFDLDKLQGGIRVRRARAGERLTLLDGTELEPDEETLLIADESVPLALAGIMGGLDSAVTDESRNIFLESAFFAPQAIAGKARRYGLATDSSHRFERGVDFVLQRQAIERATALLLEIVGGEPGPVIERCSEANLPGREPILLRRSRIVRVLGMEVDSETVSDIMGRLGMEVHEEGEDWRITPPAFRFDIAIETDLIEEIARVTGYDRLPTAVPMAHLDIRPDVESRVDLSRLRHLLADRGYQEAITYSFVEPGLLAKLGPDPRPIPLSNPISADMAVMRTTLWPGLLQAVRYNQNRQQERVRLFESGLVFLQDGAEIRQEMTLSGVISGPIQVQQWDAEPRPVDFYDIKADVENLLGLGGAVDGYSFTSARHPALHPGQAALIERDGKAVGRLGALHPGLLDSLELSGPVYLFELNLARVEEGRLPRFEPLSRYPAIRRDLAIIVDEGVSSTAVMHCIGQAAPDVLKKLQLFDLYRGEHIDSGKKSMAFGLTLQAPSRTLIDAEVDALMAKVLGSLQQQLGARLRG